MEKEMTDEQTLTDDQVEHIAVYAAERGLTDLEDACDEHLAEGGLHGELIDHTEGDDDLMAWMQRGNAMGYSSRAEEGVG